MRGYLNDYVGMESGEGTQGVFQVPEVGRCPMQLRVDTIDLENRNGEIVVNPPEFGRGPVAQVLTQRRWSGPGTED